MVPVAQSRYLQTTSIQRAFPLEVMLMGENLCTYGFIQYTIGKTSVNSETYEGTVESSCSLGRKPIMASCKTER